MTLQFRRLFIAILLSSCSPSLDSHLHIVGGSPVTKELYKENYQSIGSLQWGVIHRCGATLIAADKVVTAAHCLVAFTQEEVREHASLVFGAPDLEDKNNSGIERLKIESFRVHPGYDPETFHNDIAVIRLKTASRQKPALANLDPGFPAVDSEVFVAGWGDITDGGYRPADLRHTALAVVDGDRCRYQYESGYTIFDENICAFGISTDACHGDSGGPLYSFQNNEIKLVGIVSWGYGCALSFPGVYTRVSAYDLEKESETWPLWK